jgi:hypothetical protein
MEEAFLQGLAVSFPVEYVHLGMGPLVSSFHDIVVETLAVTKEMENIGEQQLLADGREAAYEAKE